MSEPKAVANEIVEVVENVLHWHVADDRLGGAISSAYAVRTDEGVVLIDPVPLAPGKLEELGEIAAIVITSGSHQRSAWRLRAELEVPVWAPSMAHELEEDPDERYGHESILPGDLAAFYAPGAGVSQHTLFLEGEVAFVPDLLVNPPGGPLAIAPLEYFADPEAARTSLQQLVDQPFDVLCLSHGMPVHDAPQDAIQALLDEWPEPEIEVYEPEDEEPADPERP
jgi:hypothetical protein